MLVSARSWGSCGLVQTCWLMDFDAWYASFAQILFNLFRRVHTLCKEWCEHNGQDVKVQSGMLDTNQGSEKAEWCFAICIVCLYLRGKKIKRTGCKKTGRQAARAIIHFSQSSRICLLRFYQESIFMLIDLKKQLCTRRIVSVLLRMRVCVVVSLCV